MKKEKETTLDCMTTNVRESVTYRIFVNDHVTAIVLNRTNRCWEGGVRHVEGDEEQVEVTE